MYCCTDWISITKIFHLWEEVVFGLQKYLGCQRRWYFNFTFYPNTTITEFCTVQLFVIHLVYQLQKYFACYSKIFRRTYISIKENTVNVLTHSSSSHYQQMSYFVTASTNIILWLLPGLSLQIINQCVYVQHYPLSC